MTLQQLEYILAVDKFRHFGKAAEYCNVTQPTLSAMIQKLEEELDTKIFDRGTQPISPTPIGIHIIEEAKGIVNRSAHLKDIIEETRQSLKGKLTLGILPTIAPYLLPRFFPQFIKKYKDLEVKVVELQTKDIKKGILNGELDAGIVANLEGMEEFRKTILFYEQFFAYVAKGESIFDHRIIKTADLSNEQLWMLDEGHCFRDQMVKFCELRAAKESQLVYHLGSMETFMRMVESGKGVTFIPELATLQLSDSQKQLVRPFAIPSPTRCIQIITKQNFIRETLLEALRKAIVESVPKEMWKPKPTQVIV